MQRNGQHTNLTAEQPLNLLPKCIYGAGQIANAVKTILFGIFSLFFYTTVMGLSGTLVGIAAAIGLVWDAAVDPVIGMLSDRTTGRFGKRHGFMFVGAAAMGLSFWAFFSPPSSLSAPALFAWFLATSLLVRTTTSVFGIPYYAFGAELSGDYHIRTQISAIRGGFAFVGTLGAAVLSFLLFFAAGSDGTDPKMNPQNYHAMGLFCGALMTGIALISTFGTLRYRQHANRLPTQSIRQGLRGFFGNMLLALENSSFRMVCLSYSLFFLGIVINGTLSIHFLAYYAGVGAGQELSLFHLSFYIGGLCGVALWVALAKRLEKRWMYFSGIMATSIVIGCAYLLIGEGKLFGTGNLTPLLWGHGIAGVFASVLWIIPASMIADIADEDALRSGERREGSFFGLFHFCEQIAAGTAILITGFLIDWFAGLIPGAADQSIQTINRLGVMYSLLPAAILTISALFILRYSLNQETVAAIQTELVRKNRALGAETRQHRARYN